MVRFAQFAARFSIASFVATGLQIFPPVKAFLTASPFLYQTFNLAVGLGALATFVSWGMAVKHWGTSFAGTPEEKSRWGSALIFGMFVAGWAYWLVRRQVPEVAGT